MSQKNTGALTKAKGGGAGLSRAGLAVPASLSPGYSAATCLGIIIYKEEYDVEVYIVGKTPAEVSIPSSDYPPSYLGGTNTFDQSRINPGQIGACAILFLSDVSGQNVVGWRWYGPDGNLVSTADYTIPSNPDGWYWYYVWSGLINGVSIKTSGDYRVDILLNGALLQQLNFTVTGLALGFTISKVELKYDSSLAAIPVSNIPKGKSGLVHVWVKNNMPSDQQIGLAFGEADPDGLSWSGGSAYWPTPYISAGQEKEFTGGRFTFGKEGTWTITITIYNKTNGSYETFSRFDGVLCTVVPVALVQGTITKKELEYNQSRAAIPASDIPKDKNGLVHIWGRNDTSSTQRMGMGWSVRDPDGVYRENYETWEAWPYTGAGSEHEFIGGRFPLDKAGTWIINLILMMNPDSPTIVDHYSGTLCTVVPEGGGSAETTVSLAPGESKNVAFDVTPAAARTYQVSADGLTGSFSAR